MSHQIGHADSYWHEVNQQAKVGIRVLLIRQVIVQGFTFAGGIILARVLDPAQFGLFTIATFLVYTCALLGDFGLSPSFIQRRTELTDLDLQVAFTLQQILTTLVVGVLWILAPWMVGFYPLAPPETVWLVRTLAFSLYLTSWRTMSALQLERGMKYEHLARIEVLESLCYQAIAVGLALAGYGVWSFVWAVLARGLLGTVMVYLHAPWPIHLRFHPNRAWCVLRAGLPYQLQVLIFQVGSWVTPTLVASHIGLQAVGYLTWAASNGRKPLLLVDSITRIAFPHFARVQQDAAEVERLLSRYLNYLLLMAGLWFTVIFVAGSSLVAWIYTEKWLPAVLALILYALLLGLDSAGSIVTATLNSLGRVGFVTRVVVVHTAINISLGIILVFTMGYNGIPLAYLVSSALTGFWLFTGLGAGMWHRVMRSVVWITVPIVAAATVGKLSLVFPLYLAFKALLSTIITAATFIAIAWLASPVWLRTSMGQSVLALIGKQKESPQSKVLG